MATEATRSQLAVIENLDEKINEIREYIEKQYEKNKELYDESDIERVRTDDWTVERFIRRRKTMKESIEMLDNTLKFRHEMDMPRLKEDDFPEEFHKIGTMFCYANDKQGNGMIYFRIRLHRKVKELEREFKQFILFNVEKMDRITNGNGIGIVFDMKGAGISNMDMDMIWFLVSSLLNYYPIGINYILVYELTWIFQSAWNVIKGWLPAETRNKIKFCKEDEIFDYIDRENLPMYLDGTCRLNYHHVPKNCRSSMEIGQERGKTLKEINKFMKIFQPLLDEADEESKILQSDD
ncbi:motile sperm domain-containing protein 2 [Dermatophagoides farinae]|uniref:Motile sperm domain-containing protein 2-like protein n=1 Tax=Dermatophagoides farinae TaxID=6954 RepID=A0A9D4SCU0_DERFA|nr:motile sperm domain-containing protein 2-like [Dermatophagoides farinae]XP_046914195.1 motile sperm domain-containing protein 2-like [Dermatophagoides farinae]KAH7636921.1 motile sperm domain-containing protein 2-like protein [Dermatophagoides farinae]